MSATSDYQRLRSHLAFLRLSAAAEALPALLEEAVSNKALSPTVLLERLLAVEVDAVDERRRASLARFASLPSPFTLADFDFSAQPSVDPALIADLATLRFVEDATNVLLIGPPGVGKRCWPSGSDMPRWRRGCAPATPPPPTSSPAATGPPWRAGGPPPCASSPGPGC